MQKRRLGKAQWDARVISFGAWAIGTEQGETDDDTPGTAPHCLALPLSGGTVTLSLSPVRPRWFRA